MGSVVHIAIVEDEAAEREKLKEYLNRYSQENGDGFRISEFSDPTDFLTNYKAIYDLAFMDIQMPFMDGMSAAERLRQVDPSVILVFVTNMSNYAVKGYSVDATDFIVKPIGYPSFSAMMAKVMRLLKAKGDTIIVKTAEGRMRVDVDSIKYVEVLDHRTCYHTEFGDIFIWSTLTAEEGRLPQERFARCGKYCIVNLRYVDNVSDGKVFVAGSEIPLSRNKKKAFTDKLLSYYGGIV